MADLRLNNPQNIITGLTNDVKARMSTDNADVEMSSSQFLEVMIARLTALSSTEEQIKSMVREADKAAAVSGKDDAGYLRNTKGLKEDPVALAKEIAAEKAELHSKIKERLRDLAEKDTTPVKDTKSLKALKKVAEFLVKADAEGKIDLPPAVVQKLQDFIAKGDDFRAFDMASFMRDFIDAFRTVIVQMPAQTATAADATIDPAAEAGDALIWPPEVVDALKELGMKSENAGPEQPLTMMDILRTVKSLVAESEDAAIATLNEKTDTAELPQDRAAIMVVGQTGVAAAAAPKMTETKPALPKGDKATAPVSAEVPLTLTQMAKQAAGPDRNKTDAKKDNINRDDATPARTSSADAQVKASAVLSTALAAEVKVAAAADDAVAKNLAQPAPTIDGAALNTKVSARAPAAPVLTSSLPSAATQQVIAQIQQRGGDKGGQISVQLTPAELGRVEVRVSIRADGTAHTVVMVDRPETLALMQKDASHLERALQQAGLNANSENMSFNLRDQQQAHGDQGRKRFSRSNIGGEAITDINLSALSESQIITDSRVNYHA